MADSVVVGASFDEYVKTQIQVRQEKLGLGLKDQEILQFENSNTPFIRLSSGVNVDNTVLQQLGLQGNSLYTDNGLASYYKLYGGRFLYINSAITSYDRNALTSGYGYYDGAIGQYPTSYGFYSNADYGLVPPPGIKSIDIKAMNRGSLREANIEIQCHNLQQFQIIEVLYMRLKYSILLEWGHSIYFNNKGQFQQNRFDLSNKFLSNSPRASHQNMLDSIKTARRDSNGNYDAFFGLVTNFSWTLRPDGGYDITMTARSTGDIIESLKINTSYPVKSGVPIPDLPNPPSGSGDPPVPSMQANYYRTTINRVLSTLPIHVYPSRNYAHGVNLGDWSVCNSSLATATGLQTVYNRSIDESVESNYLTWNEVICWTFPYLYGGAYANNGTSKNIQYYLKLGTLLRILESFLVYYDTSKSDKNGNPPVVKMDYNYNDNFCLTFPRHASTDPKVCLIPLNGGQIEGSQTGNLTTKTTYGFITVLSAEPGVFFTNTANAANNYASAFGQPISKTEFSPESTAIAVGDTAYYLDATGPQTLLDNIYTTSGGRYTYDILRSTDEIYNSLNSAPQITIEASKPYVTGFVTDDLGLKYFYDGTDPNNFATYLKNFNDAGGNGPLADIEIGVIKEITKYQHDWAKERQVRFEQNLGRRTESPVIAVRGRRESIVIQSFLDGNSNYSSNSENLGVYDWIKDTGFKNADESKQYIGNLMHMYVAGEYISAVLDKNVNDDGELSLYNFLSNLMKGIQTALGNINSFEVIYNEDDNIYKIIDNTFIPGLTPAKSIVQFNANILKNNYGSFIQNVNFKTKLSNNFATMTTVGAQKNGNVVGSNSTALSRWNVGLEDRIISERSNPNGVGTDTVENAYLQNISRLVDFNNKVNRREVTEADISRIRGAMSDIFKSEIGEFTNSGKIPGIGFIPFDLELVMLGLSGPRIYESYTIDTTLLPSVYKDKIQFICSGVSHRVDENGWMTTLNSICGPKYSDVIITAPPNVDNFTSINVNEDEREADGSNGRLLDSALKSIGIGNHRLSITAADAFILMKAAMDAAGVEYNLTDSYRTFEVQNDIFDWDAYVASGGNRTDTSPKPGTVRRKKGTNVAAAFPGTSNHGLGIAIDIFPVDGASINVQKWIRENGVTYGWSWTEGRSINEPWHFTYKPDDDRVYNTDRSGNPI
jgi:hypothetical protein